MLSDQHYTYVAQLTDADLLQKDIDELVAWEQKWQLRFSTDKCKVMHLGGQHNEQACYKMKGVVLSETR